MSFDFLTNYNLALHGNYCVSNWFSLPFAYKRKWEREGKALTLRALARILRTECGYSARRRAVKTFKSAKGVWGKTRVFPHKQHIQSSHDYPPKQSGGLFRKNITHLNYSFPQQHNKPKFSVSLRDPDPISHKNKAAFRQP